MCQTETNTIEENKKQTQIAEPERQNRKGLLFQSESKEGRASQVPV